MRYVSLYDTLKWKRALELCINEIKMKIERLLLQKIPTA